MNILKEVKTWYNYIPEDVKKEINIGAKTIVLALISGTVTYVLTRIKDNFPHEKK